MYKNMQNSCNIVKSPANKASREVANLTERKNLHTPVYGVKEFVCLSVCLSVCLLPNLTPIISGLAKQNGLKLFLESLQVWLPELFCKLVFLQKQLITDFLAGNIYPTSPHSQGLWNLSYKFHLYLIWKPGGLMNSHFLTCSYFRNVLENVLLYICQFSVNSTSDVPYNRLTIYPKR